MTPDRLWITARDGVRLAADLYLPDPSLGPAPALLEALPYRKDDLTASSHGDDYHRLCAEGGFAVCRLDVRGTGTSEGLATDEYPPVELDDLADVIAWLARQSWSNGHVGMFGYSYSGFNSLQAACTRPPGLDAICAIYATDDRYTDDVHYIGGALRAIDLVDYCHYMTACNALPPAPALFAADRGDEWRDEWTQAWRARIDGNEPWVLTWLEHQHDDAYWRHGSLRPDYARIECPTMIVAGWADGYRNNTLRTMAELQAPRSLLIGPWSHMAPATSLPGPNIDLVPEMIAWFDRWLRPHGSATDAPDPMARVFMRRFTPPQPDLAIVDGVWRSEATWPSTRSLTTTLIAPEGGHVSDVLVVRADVGAAAWNSCAGGLPWGQSTDQREDDAWSLTYDWPIESAWSMLGHPRLEASVSVDHPVAMLSAKLSEVAPDKTSVLITRGTLNLTHRHSSVSPEPMPVGEPQAVTVELEAAGWIFTPGHTLRLAISGADWPNAWPAPSAFRLDVDRSSLRLHLPAITGDGDEMGAFHEPRRGDDEQPSTERSDDDVDTEWRIERDVLRRTTVARTTYGGPSDARDGGRQRERYDGEVGVSIVDPARAWAAATTRYDILWPEADCSVEARMRIDSDAEAFHVTIDLDADLDGAALARRSWRRSIPRRLL